jgi:hypothetical protein
VNVVMHLRFTLRAEILLTGLSGCLFQERHQLHGGCALLTGVPDIYDDCKV